VLVLGPGPHVIQYLFFVLWHDRGEVEKGMDHDSSAPGDVVDDHLHLVFRSIVEKVGAGRGLSYLLTSEGPGWCLL
jgi:hypothetical protein